MAKVLGESDRPENAADHGIREDPEALAAVGFDGHLSKPVDSSTSRNARRRHRRAA
jgi:hypothetical protein